MERAEGGGEDGQTGMQPRQQKQPQSPSELAVEDGERGLSECNVWRGPTLESSLHVSVRC